VGFLIKLINNSGLILFFRVPLELMEQEVRALNSGVQRLDKQIQHAPDDIKIQFSGNIESVQVHF